MSQILGEIRIFTSNFAPLGWALCNGQLLPIAQNTALFALLGTMYGGNGQTTFGLPDLRGRFPMGAGAGMGLTPREIGQAVGSETVALTEAQIPAHVHQVRPLGEGRAVDRSPAGNVYGVADAEQYGPASPGATMQPLATTGQGHGHNNLSPYVAVNFIIATQGVFPQRPW